MKNKRQSICENTAVHFDSFRIKHVRQEILYEIKK